MSTTGPELQGAAAAATSGAVWEPVRTGGRSLVWRARFDDRADLAVKRAAPAAGDDDIARARAAEAVALVHAEAERLAWIAEHLHGRGLPVPGIVVLPDPDDPDPVLVTSWLEGTIDPRLMRSPEIAVENFGRALASLHEASRRVDLDGCPFDASLDAALDAASDRVGAGLVDTTVLEDPYDRYTPAELLDRVRTMAAVTASAMPVDRVLLHGDLCVSNIVFDPAYSTTVGAIDWAWAGVGDRHRDLAVTARSLARNFSGEVLPDFFAAYGMPEPDLLRIETYVTLEELF